MYVWCVRSVADGISWPLLDGKAAATVSQAVKGYGVPGLILGSLSTIADIPAYVVGLRSSMQLKMYFRELSRPCH